MLFKNIWGALRLRRIQAAVVSSLVLAGSLSFLDLPAAAASTDVAAPAVVSNYVPTATPLDVTNASARLTLKVRLSDETGVTNGFLVRVWNPETDQYYWLSNHSLVSGNLQNGVWQVTATVPQGAAAGRWIIQIFNLSDPLNNRSNGFIDLREVTIISANSTDKSAPAVVSNYVPTATPLDVTNASARLTLKVRLSDETGVTNGFLVRVWNPETDQYYWLSNHSLVSGNLQNGVWQVTATVPQGAAAGRWIIQIFNLSDPLNNRSNGFIDLREVTIISA